KNVKLQAGSLVQNDDQDTAHPAIKGETLTPQLSAAISDIISKLQESEHENDMELPPTVEDTANIPIVAASNAPRSSKSHNRLFIKGSVLANCRRRRKRGDLGFRHAGPQGMFEDDVIINACSLMPEDTADINWVLTGDMQDDEHYLVLSYLEHDKQEKDAELLCI